MTVTLPPPQDLEPIAPGLVLHDSVVQRIEENIQRPPARGGWIPCTRNFVGSDEDFIGIREF